mgnify:CR=1 FL=1
MTVKYRGVAADDKFMIQGVATDSAACSVWAIYMRSGAALGHGVTPAEVEASEASLTGRYMSGKLKIPVPAKRHRLGEQLDPQVLRIAGASGNNLRGHAWMGTATGSGTISVTYQTGMSASSFW